MLEETGGSSAELAPISLRPAESSIRNRYISLASEKEQAHASSLRTRPQVLCRRFSDPGMNAQDRGVLGLCASAPVLVAPSFGHGRS